MYFNSKIKNMKRGALLIIVFVWFTTIKAQQHFTNYTSKNTITAIADDGNKVWIGTAAGLYARSKSTGAIILTYNIDNVLPSSFVNDVLVDPFGNLWVATVRGLAKFDGTVWTIYDRSTGLKYNNVKYLTVDQSGSIWLAYSGTRYFSKLNADSTFTDYTIPSTSIRDIHAGPNGNIWIGTYGAGAYKFDGTNFTQYKKMGSSNRVYDIITDAKGNLWFAGYSGLAKYDFSTWSFYTTDQGLAANGCMALTTDINGDIWIGHYANGVTQFTPSDSTAIVYNASDGLEQQYTKAITIDSDAKLWVGTRYGLYTYDGTDWKTFMVGNSISNNQVYDVAVAQDSAIWVGTEYGLSKLKNDTWTSYFHKDGLIQDRVKTVAIDPNGNIWSGANLGLTFFDGTDFTTYNGGSYNVGQAEDIFVCSDASIWVASSHYGLTHYDGSTWSNYKEGDGLISDKCKSVIQASDGNVWVATDKGISFWNGSTFKNYTISDGLPNNYIHKVYEDDNHKIWALTNNGAAVFNGTTWDKVTDILSTSYYDMFQNTDSKFWITSQYGAITKYDGTHYVKYTEDNGLANNKVYATACGFGGEKWFATEAGLSCAVCEKPELLFDASKTCLPESTDFTNLSTKVDATTSYKWDILNDGTIDTTSFETSYTFPTEGTYQIKLIAYNDACGTNFIKSIQAHSIPIVSLNHTGTYDICDGSSVNLEVSADKSGYDYLWSNDNTHSSINVYDEGTYTVTVSNSGCDATPLSVFVHVLKPFAPQICMVTVDTAEGKNLIVWEKPETEAISYFNIFKEETTNNYRLIGSKFYNETSEFIDPTSSPSVHADKYKISAVDTCGNQSELSTFHQTMNLSQAQGTQEDELVLLWNKYIDESGNFTPASYKVYRGTDANNLTLETELTGGLSTYNYNAESVVDGEKFLVVIDMPTCTPTRATGGPYYQSTSNLEDEGIIKTETDTNASTQIKYTEIKDVTIYPNPNNGQFTILFPQNTSANIFIYNALGKIILTKKISQEKSWKPSHTLQKGIYLVKIDLENQKTTTQRIIVR